jgi:arsenate reductase (thioredoxin)
MLALTTVGALFCMGACMAGRVPEADVGPAFYPQAQRYLQQRVREFDQVSDERKGDLKKIAQFVQDQNKAGKPAKLVFICTHNSRRSQMAQIWAAAGATHFGVHGLEAFSGGTEATAFNPRAIAAIERAGLKVERVEEGKNPRYSVRFLDTNQALICFSKVYSDSPNPKQDFCAVMTCAQADKACPLVQGCSLRVAIPYEDPKSADDTPEEKTKYDERCAQIAREMLFLFSQVKK